MSVEYTELPPENCRGLVFRSHEYWECYVKQRGYSWLHIVGTCSMGLVTDSLTVVDSKLRYNAYPNTNIESSLNLKTVKLNFQGSWN